MNKKIILKNAIYALFVGILITSTTEASASQIETLCIQQEQVEYEIKTKGSNVNLRKGPGINNGVIVKIPNGSKVVKISDYQNGKWAKTVYTNDKGKEYIGYILYDEEYVKEKCTIDSKLGLITGDRVVFRAGGSITARKYGYFYKGNIVEILEEANVNGYLKVRVVNTDCRYPYAIGYVHADYVRL